MHGESSDTWRQQLLPSGQAWLTVTTLGRYLGLGNFSEWSEDERVEWLVKELQSRRPLVPPAMPLTDEVKEVSSTRVTLQHGQL